jgi:hypothetical protein
LPVFLELLEKKSFAEAVEVAGEAEVVVVVAVVGSAGLAP